jgi:hypothetical protein
MSSSPNREKNPVAQMLVRMRWTYEKPDRWKMKEIRKLRKTYNKLGPRKKSIPPPTAAEPEKPSFL